MSPFSPRAQFMQTGRLSVASDAAAAVGRHSRPAVLPQRTRGVKSTGETYTCVHNIYVRIYSQWQHAVCLLSDWYVRASSYFLRLLLFIFLQNEHTNGGVLRSGARACSVFAVIVTRGRGDDGARGDETAFASLCLARRRFIARERV